DHALVQVTLRIRQHQVLGTVLLEVLRQMHPVIGTVWFAGKHLKLVMRRRRAGQPLLDKVMPDHAVADNQQPWPVLLVQRCQLLLYTSHTAPRAQKKRRPLSASHLAKGKRTPLSVKSDCLA